MYTSIFLPVVVLCVRREWRGTEAHWCCRWQRHRGRRSAEYRWEIWRREGQSLHLCRIQTQSCRGSGSGPGSPRPAPAQPVTSTARPPSAASGEQRQKTNTHSERGNEIKQSIKVFFLKYLCKCYILSVVCLCCTWICEQAVSQGWWASTLLMLSRSRRRRGAASKPCNHLGSPPTLRKCVECRYTR